MRVEGSDGLAGGWLFAHLEVLLTPQCLEVGPHRVRARAPRSTTPKPATELRAPTSCLRAICLGHRGDPRGRPLRANPSTRPSGQPARRAWVAAPAFGHGGRLCGGAEAGEVLLASSRRPGGSWCEPSSHYKSLAASLSGLARLRSWLTAFVAVGLPLTRQRGNRPGFLPSE